MICVKIMGDNGVKIITSADDMEFFKTILKYMKKMQPVDNFDFRQAMMAIIRKYYVDDVLDYPHQFIIIQCNLLILCYLLQEKVEEYRITGDYKVRSTDARLQ